MVEWLLIAVLYTPHAASHIHDIHIERFEHKYLCEMLVDKYKRGAVCIPVAPLPISNE